MGRMGRMILLYREKSFFSTREIDEKTVPIVPTETKPLENQGDPRGASFATTMPKLPTALDSKWTPRVGVGEWGVGKCLKGLVDLEGFEPSTSSMPWKRAPNCATGPRFVNSSTLRSAARHDLPLTDAPANCATGAPLCRALNIRGKNHYITRHGPATGMGNPL